MSCDAYDDLWRPFFSLLERHWSDCPFPVFLGAETKSFPKDNIHMLHPAARGRNWSGELQEYLDMLPTQHVLLMLDDFFLRRTVPTARILRALKFAQRSGACAVRLVPLPGPTDPVLGESEYGVCAAGLPYRASAQAAIWNRTLLRDLLRPGESIWEFEHRGNARANLGSAQYYCTWDVVLPYPGRWAHHVVEKGKWFPHQKWIFARQEIGCDFSRRSTLPWAQTLVYHLARGLDRALDILPWRTKKKFKVRLRALAQTLFPRAVGRLGGRPPS